jgi:hypothetical protein
MYAMDGSIAVDNLHGFSNSPIFNEIVRRWTFRKDKFCILWERVKRSHTLDAHFVVISLKGAVAKWTQPKGRLVVRCRRTYEQGCRLPVGVDGFMSRFPIYGVPLKKFEIISVTPTPGDSYTYLFLILAPPLATTSVPHRLVLSIDSIQCASSS